MAANEIIIETEGLKRRVPLPAAICLTREAAYQIRDAMEAFIGKEGCTYGWVTIHREQAASAGANTVPLEWDEAGPNRPRNR